MAEAGIQRFPSMTSQADFSHSREVVSRSMSEYSLNFQVEMQYADQAFEDVQTILQWRGARRTGYHGTFYISFFSVVASFVVTSQ